MRVTKLTVTEFNISVIVVTKIITFKFFVVFCSGCMTDLLMVFQI